ncbi:MAG: hypothetical protein GPOALKHO_000412 [Sodalis sp.]|nr:MAG: hypothetical protein GPOALKHO_000412 [Sodalis sp.]
MPRFGSNQCLNFDSLIAINPEAGSESICRFCYQLIAKRPLSHCLNTLPVQLIEWEHTSLHGKFTQWFRAVEKPPTLTPRVWICCTA